MALTRMIFSSVKHGFKNLNNANLNSSNHFAIMLVQVRNISYMEVTKNLSLISKEKKKTKLINLKLEHAEDKPLVVMLSWLMAKKRHVFKYADIYLQHGFDVLNVSVSPWQLLWPTKGAQVVARDILKFLEVNTACNPLLIHGFSVGGYVWGEVMVQMAAETERYKHVIDRISGQIWDSTVDVTEIQIGVPVAVFPRNMVLQAALQKYILYHMKTFDKVATRHYIRSSQMFHTNLVKAPSQFFISKTDPIGSEKSNLTVKENWENMGIQVYWKCWERSPHVGHFRHHPKEYTEGINNFLEIINLLKSDVKQPKKMQAKV